MTHRWNIKREYLTAEEKKDPLVKAVLVSKSRLERNKAFDTLIAKRGYGIGHRLLYS